MVLFRCWIDAFNDLISGADVVSSSGAKRSDDSSISPSGIEGRFAVDVDAYCRSSRGFATALLLCDRRDALLVFGCASFATESLYS